MDSLKRANLNKQYLNDRDNIVGVNNGNNRIISALRKSTMSRISISVIIIISAIIGAIAGGGVAFYVFSKSLDTQISAQLTGYTGSVGTNFDSAMMSSEIGYTNIDSTKQPGSAAPNFLDGEEIAVTNVYRELSPSVVHVSTIQYYRNFFFQVVPQEGTGSGFIISEDGYILTNNHVVRGAHNITVRLASGDEYQAELVGTDQMTDIAVLKISSEAIDPSWVAPLGNSDTLQVGQRAIAIGNPFGLDSTVTVGVISALNRPVSTQETSFESMIQTDASINPGNSGGPLMDSSGDVIGINTVIFSQSGGSHGIGFAIPINAAKRVSADLIDYGRVRRPSLGFWGLQIGANLAEVLGLSVKFGVLVQDVEGGSAAALAGLQGGQERITLGDRHRQFNVYIDGDIIIALNGDRIDALSTLADSIIRSDIGTEVTLTVIRAGEQIELTMVLAE